MAKNSNLRSGSVASLFLPLHPSRTAQLVIQHGHLLRALAYFCLMSVP